MPKTKVIYQFSNPYSEGLTFIAIQTGTNPPYVWATYTTKDRKELPLLPNDMLVLHIEQAKKLFDFKEGNIAELVR